MVVDDLSDLLDLARFVADGPALRDHLEVPANRPLLDWVGLLPMSNDLLIHAPLRRLLAFLPPDNSRTGRLFVPQRSALNLPFIRLGLEHWARGGGLSQFLGRVVGLLLVGMVFAHLAQSIGI